MSQAKPRVWEVHRFDDEGGVLPEQDFRQMVADSMLEAETIGHRLGGTFMAVPKRQEVQPDVWVTVGWRFLWQSYAPGSQRRDQAQQAPIPDPEEWQEAPEDELEPEFPEDGFDPMNPDAGAAPLSEEELARLAAS